MVKRCYSCDDNLDSMIEASDESDQQIKNLSKFRDDIKQLIFKQNNKQKPKNIDRGFLEEAKTVKESEANMIEKNKKTISLSSNRNIFGLRNIGNTCFFNSVMQVS